jgi:hypothetical protein
LRGRRFLVVSVRACRDNQGRTMSDQTTIEAVTRRLSLALDALEAAVERKLEADGGEARLAQQLHALGEDRSRLAADLDAQTARARQLETANRDIAQRLDQAIANIQAVVESQAAE